VLYILADLDEDNYIGYHCCNIVGGSADWAKVPRIADELYLPSR